MWLLILQRALFLASPLNSGINVASTVSWNQPPKLLQVISFHFIYLFLIIPLWLRKHWKDKIIIWYHNKEENKWLKLGSDLIRWQRNVKNIRWSHVISCQNTQLILSTDWRIFIQGIDNKDSFTSLVNNFIKVFPEDCTETPIIRANLKGRPLRNCLDCDANTTRLHLWIVPVSTKNFNCPLFQMFI